MSERYIKCTMCGRIYFLTKDENAPVVCKFMNHRPAKFCFLTKEEIENIPIGITISGIREVDDIMHAELDKV